MIQEGLCVCGHYDTDHDWARREACCLRCDTCDKFREAEEDADEQE